jgi:lipid II:glycine glycyltransferase (peptidoglycan interpeptide bridge formation enzyme)
MRSGASEQIISPPHSHYLQHAEWAAVRRRYDWQTHQIGLATPDGEQPVTVYKRRVTPIGRLAYAPYCLPVLGVEQVDENLERMRVAMTDCFAVIVEPQQLERDTDRDVLRNIGLKRAFPAGIQNLSSLFIDLGRSEDDIFGRFTKEKRYNVRKAEKRGVLIRELEPGPDAFNLIYAFKQATIERAGHYYRPKKFMYEMWDEFARAGKLRVFVAYHQDRPVSGVAVLHDGWQAWSRDSGSLREGSSLGAPSYMQWEVMKALKKSAVERYDLCGIRPADQRDPSNPRYGIFRYKSGFAPEGIEDYCGPYDLVLEPRRYAAWLRWKGLYLRWSMSITKNYFF